MTPLGSISTFPVPNTPTDLSLVVSSCAKYLSRTSAVEGMLSHSPSLYINTGDLVYSDISDNSVNVYIDAYIKVLNAPKFKDLFSSVALAYMWDDHDFGPNDADIKSPSRPAAIEAYRDYTPHYPLNYTTTGGIVGEEYAGQYQAFTYGRIRVILLDLRSMMEPPTEAGDSSALGPRQKPWFFDQLSQWANYRMMIIVSSIPWSGLPSSSENSWRAYPKERAQISQYISTLGINNLVMLSGDSHMLAMDDGTNSDFSHDLINGSPAGFPYLQSGPISQFGSTKAGAFSHGCFAYEYQINNAYTLMDITDNASHTCFQWTGYHDSKPRMKLSKCNLYDSNGIILSPSSSWMTRGVQTQSKPCELRMFDSGTLAGIILGVLFLVGVVVIGVGICVRVRRGQRCFGIEKWGGKREKVEGVDDEGDGDGNGSESSKTVLHISDHTNSSPHSQTQPQPRPQAQAQPQLEDHSPPTPASVSNIHLK